MLYVEGIIAIFRHYFIFIIESIQSKIALDLAWFSLWSQRIKSRDYSKVIDENCWFTLLIIIINQMETDNRMLKTDSIQKDF